MSKKISVCIATYNGEKYIKEQVDSIIRQLGPNDEVIISDDESSDATINILEDYHDDRIIIYHHVSKGANSFEKATANFENALNHATGDFIFLSDQDDIWREGKVKTMTEALKHNLFVQCQLETFGVVDDNLNHILGPLPKSLIYCLYKLPFVGCCMGFRRELLELALPFPKGIRVHDAWLGMIGKISGRAAFVSNPFQLYRLHNNNVSGSAKSDNSLFVKLSYRLILLYNVIIRYLNNRSYIDTIQNRIA